MGQKGGRAVEEGRQSRQAEPIEVVTVVPVCLATIRWKIPNPLEIHCQIAI